MTLFELEDKMEKFTEVNYLFFKESGHLIWKYGTGGNVEIFDIEAYEKGKGIGKKLVKGLVDKLKENPPHSIFGFTAKKNINAQGFYKALGFDLIEIENLYPKGAYIFSMTYKKALKI